MAKRLRDGRTAVISHATEHDARAVLEHLESVAGESDFLSFGPGEIPFVYEEELEYLRRLADPANGLALKAEVDGRFAAMATIVRGTRPRFRHTGTLGLGVQRTYWGLGLGRALSEAALAAAEQAGMRRITLFVRADNLRAIRLYEALGFRHEGRMAGGFAVGDVEYDDLVMGLRFASR